MTTQDDLRKQGARLAKLLRQAEKLAGPSADKAAAHSGLVSRISRDQYAALAEVAPPCGPQHKRRRSDAGKSLLRFLKSYFPHSTGLKPFSEDHKRIITEIERIIYGGGRLVNAIYRGAAKTTISEHAAIWAVLYGYRRFVLIVGINKVASAGNIDSIKAELAENDLLAEDFPEVCKYIRALENKPQRCPHQTCGGKHTHIVWRADTIVLPMIDGSAAGGAIIASKPYAKARGVKFKRRDGIQARPDLVVVDDPQDDVSATTQLQVNKNLMILRKGILQSGGRRKGLAIVVNATIIAHHDMIETLLADPAWQGERVPMVKHWANVHETLWLKEYAGIRRTFDRSTPGDQQRAHREATKFYRKHRREMDAGCLVSWKYCYKPDELSAIQHAYNILIDDGEEVFASEYQQEPFEPGEAGPLRLTAEQVAAKVTGLERGVVAKQAQHLTAYVDVHERLLYYVVSAWSPDFGGTVIDYGVYPKQPTAYFAQSSAPVTMALAHPGLTEEAWILAGLGSLASQLLGTTYKREDEAAMRIGRLLVDAKWGQKTELVKQFCRRHSQGGSIVFPAMGIGFGPTRKTFSEYRPEPGAVIGLNWRLAIQPGGHRVLSIDTNWWKTFVVTRLAMPLGTSGGLELFGRQPQAHSLFADHCVAEEPKTMVHKESSRERTVWEWKPGRPANNGLGKGVQLTQANYVVGRGPKLRMQTRSPGFNAMIEVGWKQWAKEVKLAQKLRTAIKAKVSDGESFTIIAQNPAMHHQVKLGLRSIECEQVSTPYLGTNEPNKIDGIEFDEFGNSLFYNVLKQHPGGQWAGLGLDVDRIPARFMLHLFREDRAGQHRGVSELHPSLNLFAQGRRYREATVASAENIANWSILLKTQTSPNEGADLIRPLSTIPIEKSMMVALPYGFDAFQPKAEQPTASYKEFVRAQSSEQARPLNMPQNIAAADSSGYSFSGGKLDHLTYFVSVDVEQEEIEEAILDPLFEVWFAEAVLRFGWGVSDSPLPSHTWDWPRKPVIDEVKTANARKTDLSTGLGGLRRIYAEDGLDLEDELPRMAEDYGVTVDELKARLYAVNLGGGAPAQPNDQSSSAGQSQSNTRSRLPATAGSNGIARTPA